MEKIRIRETKEQDLNQIMHLQNQWENEAITHGYISDEKANLKKQIGPYFLVAEKGSEINGYILGSIHEAQNMAIFNNGRRYIEIDDLYVKNEERGNHIGSLLIDKLLEIAKSDGIKHSLIYSATKDMDKIINFYQKHGYKSWYIQMYK